MHKTEYPNTGEMGTQLFPPIYMYTLPGLLEPQSRAGTAGRAEDEGKRQRSRLNTRGRTRNPLTLCIKKSEGY
ncbi:MAG: hypothetical protein QXW77_02000 [Candidatus Hadarchaeales archaeon]